jgi:predicted Zn-dependent protease
MALALSEKALIEGKKDIARKQAQRSKQNLPEYSKHQIRVDDILSFVKKNDIY